MHRLALLIMLALPLVARSLPAQADHLQLKWMRDSEEFAAIFRQTYALAAQAVEQQARALPRGTAWAVAIDLDETVLDNLYYQFERAAYGLPFDTASWNAWVRREQAGALPGAATFLTRVRELGGRVAYISDREDQTREATRRNLVALGLWRDGDLLCLETPDPTYTKRARREGLRTGTGRCASPGEPLRVLAYLGDNLGDIPDADEAPGDFGVNWFVLPNPAYGSWERRVTRGSRFRN